MEILSCSRFTRLSMSLILDLFQMGEVVISYRLTVFEREGSSSFRFASPISSKFIIKDGAREMTWIPSQGCCKASKAVNLVSGFF